VTQQQSAGDMLALTKTRHIDGHSFVFVFTYISCIIYNLLVILMFSFTLACTSLFAVPVVLTAVYLHLVETFVSSEIMFTFLLF
jgi:hypothetical protein